MEALRLLSARAALAKICPGARRIHSAPPKTLSRAREQSKRQRAANQSLLDTIRTTGGTGTPTPPAQPHSTTQPAASQGFLGAEEVAFELGRMIAHCSSQNAFREQYKRLLSSKPTTSSSGPAWAEFTPAMCQRGRRDSPQAHPRVIGIDIEMVIRRSNGEKVPIKGAIVESVLVDGKFVRREDSWMIDPMVKLNRDDFNWKTETHGITFQSYTEEKQNAVPLSAVQDEVLRCLNLPATCLVGHMLKEDLQSLRICGEGLSHKIVDTAFYFGMRDDGGARSLKDIWAKTMPKPPGNMENATTAQGVATPTSSDRTFRKAIHHDPLEDAAVGTHIMEKEITKLVEGGSLPLLKIPSSTSRVGVFLVQDSDVKALIGPSGSNLKTINRETGARVVVCTMVMPSPKHYIVTVTSPSDAVHPKSLQLARDILPGRMTELV